MIDLDEQLAKNPEGKEIEIIVEADSDHPEEMTYTFKIERRKQERVFQRFFGPKVSHEGEIYVSPDFYEAALACAKWVTGCDQLKHFSPQKLQRWWEEVAPGEAKRFGQALFLASRDLEAQISGYRQAEEKNFDGTLVGSVPDA